MNSCLKFYYWGHPIIKNCFNFGDMVTPMLLKHYCPDGNIDLADTANNADVFSTGSIIHHIPKDRFTIILGSGLIKSEECNIPSAIFYAVRGMLTKKNLGITEDIPLGDPALLLPLVYTPPTLQHAKKPIGIVPHYVHYASACLDAFRYDEHYKIINVRAETKYVIDEICSCSAIISSSLHGLIVADAYGIPNKRLIFEGFPLVGEDFKFNDYFSSIGRNGEAANYITPAQITNNPEFRCDYFNNIPEVQKKLDAAFKRFSEDIPRLTQIKQAILNQKKRHDSEMAKFQKSWLAQLNNLQVDLKNHEIQAEIKRKEINKILQTVTGTFTTEEDSHIAEIWKQFLHKQVRILWYKSIYHSIMSRICWGKARARHLKAKQKHRISLKKIKVICSAFDV